MDENETRKKEWSVYAGSLETEMEILMCLEEEERLTEDTVFLTILCC